MSRKDRSVGALLGLAVGDALGAGYEFTVPDPGEPIVFKTGQMGFAPGEWTDDTAQAVAVASVLATGSADVGAIGQRFLDWLAAGPRDVGVSTRAVLARAGGDPAQLTAAADGYFAANPTGAAGNGSLMRTSPVALARLDDRHGRAELARRVSHLTHGDPLAADGCVLWCDAIARTVAGGDLAVAPGLDLIDPARRDRWAAAIADAEARPPAAFGRGNGFVVTALQAAWSAIVHTPGEGPAHLTAALETAVRIGHDTDTVAAIAGQLLGARWGGSAIPWRWRRRLHGWGTDGERGLTALALLTASAGRPDPIGFPTSATLVDEATAEERGLRVHGPDPDDADLRYGSLPGLPLALEAGADAVVSLCRVGAEEVPAGVEHARFRFIDVEGPDANPNLAFVVADAVDAVRTLRAEGRRVFLHCKGGRSRSATVAVAHRMATRGEDVATALAAVRTALPEARPNPTFAALLRRLEAGGGDDPPSPRTG